MKKSVFLFLSLLILSLVIFLFPLLNIILLAFKSNIDIVSLPPKIIFRPTLDHFKNAFVTGGYNFGKYFTNSFSISTLSTIISLGITFSAAYSVSRFKVGGKNFLTGIISMRFFPPILFTIPFYILFSIMGLRDTIVGIALVHSLINLPIIFPIMVSFIDEIPKSVEEAALIDGCSVWGLLRHIIFPLVLPGLITAAFINFIFSWNEYLMALILSSVEATPVTVGAGLFVRSFGVKYGELAAVITAALIPPLIVVILFKDQIIKGLTMGAVK